MTAPAGPDPLVARRDALPLVEPASLDPLVARAGDARCVLIGEANPGTAEFHHWRAELTRRLIDEQGFSFLAVEADWPACTALRERVTRPDAHLPDGVDEVREALADHRCWPTWPWANTEVLHFAHWLRRRNADRPAGDRAGVFGLDVYGLRNALPLVLAYLREHAPEHLPTALRGYACLEHCGEGPRACARPRPLAPAAHARPLVSLLVRRYREQAAAVPAEELAGFTAHEHAQGLLGAQRYYHALVGGGAEAWNVRQRHLADTLDRLLDLHGGRHHAKAVVWAHNVHVADARGSGLADAGMVSLGHLVRGRYGATRTLLTGFGSYQGTVTAADRWEGRAHVARTPPARAGSLEDRLHHALRLDAALFLVPAEPYRPGWMRQPAGHRALGVVYREREATAAYPPTVLGQGYDAFLYFDHTSALTPLHAEQQPWSEPFPEAV